MMVYATKPQQVPLQDAAQRRAQHADAMQAVATLRGQAPQSVNSGVALPRTAMPAGQTFQLPQANSDASAAYVTPARQVDRAYFQWAPGSGPSQSMQMPTNVGQGLSAVAQALFNKQRNPFPTAPGGGNPIAKALSGMFGLGSKRGGLY